MKKPTAVKTPTKAYKPTFVVYQRNEKQPNKWNFLGYIGNRAMSALDLFPYRIYDKQIRDLRVPAPLRSFRPREWIIHQV